MAKKKKSASKKKTSKSKAPKKKAKAVKKTAKKTTKKTAKKTAKAKAKQTPKEATKKPAKATAKKTAKKAAKKTSEKKPPVRKIVPKEIANRPIANRKRIFPLIVEVEPQDDAPEKKKKLKKLPAAELRKYKDLLHKLRDQAVDGISFLAGDNLNRSKSDTTTDRASSDDQGTDSFDREFALNLVSGEQELLHEIDDAFHRIVEGSYGYCQECDERIEQNRLEALPHAKMCIKCKERLEHGKTRYRPLGPTLSQSSD